MGADQVQVEDRGDEFTPEVEGPVDLGSEFDTETLAGIAGDDEAFSKDDGGEKTGDDVAGEDKEQTIPRARFDEVNAGKKAAEESRLATEAENQRLRQLLEEQGIKVDEEKPAERQQDPGDKGQGEEQDGLDRMKTELRDLRVKAREALLDGEIDTYDELTEKIDELNQDIAEERIRRSHAREASEAKVAQTLNTVAATAYDLYPFLDVNSDSADPDAINAVRNRRFELESKGKSPAEALQLAIEEKGPKFAKINGIEIDTEKANKVRQQREQNAREKAADASVRQPGLPASGGMESGLKVDINKLSDAEFDRLPASVKAKMRGDAV